LPGRPARREKRRTEAPGASLPFNRPRNRDSPAPAWIQPSCVDDDRKPISTRHGDSPGPVRAVIIVTNGRFRLYIITDTRHDDVMHCGQIK